MKKDIKLYNVLFPIWMLLIFPITWLVVLPGNFIIDTIVLLITLKVLKVDSIKDTYLKSIFKVWVFGFLSDFVCGAVLMLSQLIPGGTWWYHNITKPAAYNPFSNIFGLIFVLLAVLIAGLLIYYFNLKVSFKNTDLTDAELKKVAISIAVFTAPYVVLIPSKLLYMH